MKNGLQEDELYVVMLIEDTVSPGITTQLCSSWGAAMESVNNFMEDVCSEVWDEHCVDQHSRRWMKAKWTWGFNEIRVTVENVV